MIQANALGFAQWGSIKKALGMRCDVTVMKHQKDSRRKANSALQATATDEDEALWFIGQFSVEERSLDEVVCVVSLLDEASALLDEMLCLVRVQGSRGGYRV